MHTEDEAPDPEKQDFTPHVFSSSGKNVLSVRVDETEYLPVDEVNRTRFGYFFIKRGRLVTVVDYSSEIFGESREKFTKYEVFVDRFLPQLFQDGNISKDTLREGAIEIQEHDFTEIGVIKTDPNLLNIISIATVPKHNHESVKHFWLVYMGIYPPISYIEKNLLTYMRFLPDLRMPSEDVTITNYGYNYSTKRKRKKITTFVVREELLDNPSRYGGMYIFEGEIPEEIKLRIKGKFEM